MNRAKEILAFELTQMVHGEQAASSAQATAKSLFGGVADAENMPATTLRAGELAQQGLSILDALVACGLAASKGEARRLIQQGGISLDGEKAMDPTAVLPADALEKGLVIKKGKKVYHKLIVE